MSTTKPPTSLTDQTDAYASGTVADWYAAHVEQERALLPRTRRQQQAHWLVRFHDLTGQRVAYAQCFAKSAMLYLYPPEEPMRTVEQALHEVEQQEHPRRSRRRSLSEWLASIEKKIS